MTISEQMEIMEKNIISVLRRDIADFKKDLNNDILNFKDEIMGEIKTIRLEQVVLGGYKKTLVDHEDRISKLEKNI